MNIPSTSANYQASNVLWPSTDSNQDDIQTSDSHGDLAMIWGEPQNLSVSCLTRTDDDICRNSQKLSVPKGVFVLVSHGTAENGLSREVKNDPQYNYHSLSAEQVADTIKTQMKASGGKYDQVYILSCYTAQTNNGKYLQKVANLLGLPVTGSKTLSFVNPNGRITVAENNKFTETYLHGDNQLGYNVKYFPQNSSKPRSVTCFNDTLYSCIP